MNNPQLKIFPMTNNYNDDSLHILRLQKASLKSDMERLLIFLLPGHNRRVSERRSGVERRSPERAAISGRRGTDAINVVELPLKHDATVFPKRSDRRLPVPTRLRGLREAFDVIVQQERHLQNWKSRQI